MSGCTNMLTEAQFAVACDNVFARDANCFLFALQGSNMHGLSEKVIHASLFREVAILSPELIGAQEGHSVSSGFLRGIHPIGDSGILKPGIG